MSTPLGKYIPQKSNTGQLENTNRTGMDDINMLVTTVGSKEFAVGGACSDDMLIHSTQARAKIDRLGHGNRNIYLGSLKSCAEM